MPINAHPDYLFAEKEYLEAQTLEEKIEKLKKMISFAPKHKGGENLRAQLKTRLKKFQQQLDKNKKSKKSTTVGIKKSDMQAVIIGKTNSGKSTLLTLLTNAQPKISEIKLSTIEPVIGMMKFAQTQIQIIENPAIDSDYYDKGLTNTADTILILINSLEEIPEIEKELDKAKGKKIIIFNDKTNQNKRKISETLKSKKYNFIFLNLKNLNPLSDNKFQEGGGSGSKWENLSEDSNFLQELKNKIFNSFDNIRIYTKEPGKEKSPRPIIMKPNSTVYDVAEKILKGFSRNVVETKIWGPSSKFAGQKVGLKHKLKDLDVVEFKTR